MANRSQLWNAVEFAERRIDAWLAKEIEFALPRELPRDRWLAVAHAMADAYVAKCFVVDLAIHDDGTQRNPHVHMLLTTRVVTAAGFGPKIRSADGRQFITETRALWERVANEALKGAGVATSIDSRSNAARKLERTPGQHRDPDPAEQRARRLRQPIARDPMRPETDDADLPVPHPDGNPIHPRDLEAAEQRMLVEMHRDTALPEGREPAPDLPAARQANDRLNSRELSDDEAMDYRLAPENHLDWLGVQDQPSPPSPEEEREPKRERDFDRDDR